MPRPKKPGAPEPKTRSRTGCWPCKNRKVKCDEQKPRCKNCEKTGQVCDYSLKLNWDHHRLKKHPDAHPTSPTTPDSARSVSAPFFSEHETARPAAYHRIVPHGLVTDNLGDWNEASLLPLQSRHLPSDEYSAAPWYSGLGTVVQPVVPSGYQHRTPGLQSAEAPVLGEQYDYNQPQQLGPLPPSRKRTLSIADDLVFEHVTGKVRAVSPGSLTESSRATSRLQSGASLSSFGSPLTPATSTTFSDDTPRVSLGQPGIELPSGDRRLSVLSLLSGPSSCSYHQQDPRQPGRRPSQLRLSPELTEESPLPVEDECYGVDRGSPDRDELANDDDTLITGYAPVGKTRLNSPELSPSTSLAHRMSGLGREISVDGETVEGYYSRKVPIQIPASLLPLPDRLRDNPMELLYFHHFINHTALVLVAHENPEYNAFRTVLPQMAVKNDHLLNILLAYSASHRARFLQHPEPEQRIGLWLSTVIPGLSAVVEKAQSDAPNPRIEIADVATAIMLASLEIVSPTTFCKTLPWQKHLNLARELITKIPGGLRGRRTSRQVQQLEENDNNSNNNKVEEGREQGEGEGDDEGEDEEDQVCSFLWSWFAYLDVLGSLSGGPAESAAGMAWIVESGIGEADDANQIDCVMGFTPRALVILARIAELARRCDAEKKAHLLLQLHSRADSNNISTGTTLATGDAVDEGQPQQEPGGEQQTQGTTSTSASAEWQPDAETLAKADQLEVDALASLGSPTSACKHAAAAAGESPPGGCAASVYQAEMAAVNSAFHWAGLVHLRRRVRGLPSDDPDVQQAVQAVLAALRDVRPGGTAEACLLFPMFTAGCDLPGASEAGRARRRDVLRRVQRVARNGMTQVHRAARLMQRVWDSGQPWEMLLEQEFIG